MKMNKIKEMIVYTNGLFDILKSEPILEYNYPIKKDRRNIEDIFLMVEDLEKKIREVKNILYELEIKIKKENIDKNELEDMVYYLQDKVLNPNKNSLFRLSSEIEDNIKKQPILEELNNKIKRNYGKDLLEIDEKLFSKINYEIIKSQDSKERKENPYLKEMKKKLKEYGILIDEETIISMGQEQLEKLYRNLVENEEELLKLKKVKQNQIEYLKSIDKIILLKPSLKEELSEYIKKAKGIFQNKELWKDLNKKNLQENISGIELDFDKFQRQNESLKYIKTKVSKNSFEKLLIEDTNIGSGFYGIANTLIEIYSEENQITEENYKKYKKLIQGEEELDRDNLLNNELQELSDAEIICEELYLLSKENDQVNIEKKDNEEIYINSNTEYLDGVAEYEKEFEEFIEWLLNYNNAKSIEEIKETLKLFENIEGNNMTVKNEELLDWLEIYSEEKNNNLYEKLKPKDINKYFKKIKSKLLNPSKNKNMGINTMKPPKEPVKERKIY